MKLRSILFLLIINRIISVESTLIFAQPVRKVRLGNRKNRKNNHKREEVYGCCHRYFILGFNQEFQSMDVFLEIETGLRRHSSGKKTSRRFNILEYT